MCVCDKIYLVKLIKDKKMKDLRKNSTIGKPNAVFFERGEFCDKGMNLQIQGLDNNQKEKVLSVAFSNPVCLKAKPFKQGDYNDWLMIEFFTNDHEKSIEAAKEILNSLNVKAEDILGI